MSDGDKVMDYPGGSYGKWGAGGGGRWGDGGKGGDNGRWVYGERWTKGWWSTSGKAGHGLAKGGNGIKKGSRGGKNKDFPPGGRRGGNIKELESPDYETEVDD
ncbi:hypothetical protein TSUD_50960 [Trifolium subterraneum]|uniref:Uncharacterized protein n=1 Tax=Trifolium subterraneum TaxID=3900 RepID=A0A2Z6MI66_TRISU|nr:hypothetical protein TSUD_50960 [Trifolium subterraneum]